MPNLSIKGLSTTAHRSLKRKAKLHKRSLNQEILDVLERSVAPPPRIDIEAMLERERRFSESLGFTTTPEEIEAAIQEGRLI